MILHDIQSADIRQEDTLSKPQHRADDGELTRFDRVLANPPFSQNYSAKDIEFTGRFVNWMPEKGKKADLMFVQHMLAVLKSNGRMATIMPHGVLFRGGEEKDAREHFIKQGWLDAVIGLPPSLFYGTGIPACILVMNKEHAAEPQGRAVHQCRPRIPRRQGAELPAARGHGEDRRCLSPSGRMCRATPASCRSRRSRPKSSTATSAAMSTMRRRPSRTMCGRTSMAVFR